MNKQVQKFWGNPPLATERLLLRKLSVKDMPDVYEYAKDPEVAAYVLWQAHKSIDDAREFINLTLQRYGQDEAGEWGIELKRSGKLIGSMGFVQVDFQNFWGSIGYALAKEYWGQGIMTEAVTRLIRFGFTEMGLNRIEAVHMPENPASGRVMQKAGMVFEGLSRQKIYTKERFCDVKQYAIVKEDWLKKEGRM